MCFLRLCMLPGHGAAHARTWGCCLIATRAHSTARACLGCVALRALLAFAAACLFAFSFFFLLTPLSHPPIIFADSASTSLPSCELELEIIALIPHIGDRISSINLETRQDQFIELQVRKYNHYNKNTDFIYNSTDQVQITSKEQ